eukprot:4711718-Alexandrium_andersonii.AAC.1
MALLRAAGAGCRTPLSHTAALQAPSHIAVLLEHGLGDVGPPRGTLSPRPRGRRSNLLRDTRDHLWLTA